MPAPQNLRAAGDRIEIVLDELRATADPRSLARTEELLRLVTDLYGAGLDRIMRLAETETGSPPGLIDQLVADELVASLLLVHGLHPQSVGVRVEAALASVRPLLATHGGDVELLALDEDAGALHLRLLGSCDGCPSSAVTLQMAVERAILEAAPEIVSIDVDQPSAAVASVSVSLGTKPVYEECPSQLAST